MPTGHRIDERLILAGMSVAAAVSDWRCASDGKDGARTCGTQI